MKQLIAFFAIAAATPLFAVDGVWNKHSSDPQIWASSGNWLDSATGKTASSYPRQRGDSATFGDTSTHGIEQETVTTGCSNYSTYGSDGVDPFIDALSGDYHTVILHATSRPGDSGKVRRYFTFADGSSFWGWWTTAIPWATFVPNGDTLEKATVSSLSLHTKPVILVTNSLGTAHLATTYRGGMLVKEGAGNLVIGATTGSDTILRSEAGTVTFEGRAAETEALIARAATGSSVTGAREVFAAADWTTAPFALSDDSARGESTLDGQPVGASACKASALAGYHFVSVALPEGVTVTRTAQANGETLVFTEPLTRVERQIVNTYLRTKWGERANVDAGTVFLTAADMAIGASAGGTARLGEVSLMSGSSFRKTGDGILELTHTVPATASVTVEAGGIGVADVAPDADVTKPAADPWLWLDANRLDTMTLDGTSVTEWRDCRSGSSVKATFDSTLCSQAPTLDADVYYLLGPYQGGTNVLSFAIGKACLKLPNWLSSTPNAYSVFFAGRPIGSWSQWSTPLVGSSDAAAFRRDMKNFRAEAGLSYFSKTGRWTVDGEPVDPQQNDQPFIIDMWKYHVVSYSSSEPFLTDSILRSGTDAASSATCGGLYVGEYLIYDRELTPAERRDTEAYLLRKWKYFYVHKDAGLPCVASATFAAANPVILSSSATGTVASVAGGNGAVVKKGAGTLYVGTPLTNATSVTVEAGELKANFGFDDSMFHFDASDYDSFKTQIVDREGGSKATNILAWADIRRNGAYANYRYQAANWDYGINEYVTNPPCFCQAETTDGVMRPVVDFGQCNSGAAGGLKLDRDYENVREAIVYGMVVPASKSKPVWLFGANGGWAPKYQNWTCGDWYIFSSGAPEQILNGYFAIDGVVTDGAKNMYPECFACFDAGPTADTFINAIAIQYYYGRVAQPGTAGAGGWRICEKMAFSRNLTAAERAYMVAKLAYKWKGEGTKPVWTNATALASISVAAGATLTDMEEAHLDVAAISGTGTINCGELAGVSSLTLSGKGTLTVNGTLRFADAGAVAVDCRGAATDEKLPLVVATSIENLDLSKWTVTGTKSRTVKLSVKGGTLYGLVRATGLAVIVK